MPKRIVLSALPMLLVACASMSDPQNTDPPLQRTFLTGSHVPVRDKQTSAEISIVDPKTLLFPAPYVPQHADN